MAIPVQLPVITFVNRRNYLNTGFAGIGTVYQGLGTARTFPAANTYYTISTVTLPPGRYLVLGSSQVSESSDLIYVLAIGNQSTRFSGLHYGGGVAAPYLFQNHFILPIIQK